MPPKGDINLSADDSDASLTDIDMRPKGEPNGPRKRSTVIEVRATFVKYKEMLSTLAATVKSVEHHYMDGQPLLRAVMGNLVCDKGTYDRYCCKKVHQAVGRFVRDCYKTLLSAPRAACLAALGHERTRLSEVCALLRRSLREDATEEHFELLGKAIEKV